MFMSVILVFFLSKVLIVGLEKEKYLSENGNYSAEMLDEDEMSLMILQKRNKSVSNPLKMLGFKLKEIANVTNNLKNPQKMSAFGGITRRF